MLGSILTVWLGDIFGFIRIVLKKLSKYTANVENDQLHFGKRACENKPPDYTNYSVYANALKEGHDFSTSLHKEFIVMGHFYLSNHSCAGVFHGAISRYWFDHLWKECFHWLEVHTNLHIKTLMKLTLSADTLCLFIIFNRRKSSLINAHQRPPTRTSSMYSKKPNWWEIPMKTQIHLSRWSVLMSWD